jgi:hypothetical protein
MIPITKKEILELPKGIPTIIVPYREQAEQQRSQQLLKFTQHMKRWHPTWPIIIVEQVDEEKFNRGALLNIGSRYAQKFGAEYVVYHDVDLIPLAPLVPYYEAFPQKPLHIGTAYKGKYGGPGFIGQVLSMSMKDVKKSNGYPNMFWGWGGEDDALRNRLKKKGMEILQPDISSGFKILEHTDTRKIPGAKNMTKWEDVAGDTGQHGFRDVKWKLLSQEKDQNIFLYKVEIK